MHAFQLLPTQPAVAPFTGAWIEIGRGHPHRVPGRVAPFTGAWIEIFPGYRFSVSAGESHPSRVRGLKSYEALQLHAIVIVAPFTGAWIEILLICSLNVAKDSSHPSRVRVVLCQV